MKHLLLALLFLPGAGLAQTAAPPATPAAPATATADASGTWTLTGSVQDNPIAETCVFTQKAEALTGSCNTPEGTFATTGSVSGANVTFTHGGKYQGTDLTLTFTGTVAADGTMSGNIDVDPFQVSGDFKAQRATAANAS